MIALLALTVATTRTVPSLYELVDTVSISDQAKVARSELGYKVCG